MQHNHLFSDRNSSTAFGSAYFGRGPERLPILLDDLGCNGNETRLLECGNSGIGVNNCSHGEDAGVSCTI